jgi:hypothetical protein
MRECRQKIKEWRQLQLHGLIAEDYASGGDSDCESRASNRRAVLVRQPCVVHPERR